VSGTAAEAVHFEAQFLEYLHPQITEWRWGDRIKGEMLSVLETPSRQRG